MHFVIFKYYYNVSERFYYFENRLKQKSQETDSEQMRLLEEFSDLYLKS